MSDEDEVGYRKPPKHSQFKKGQSGNPKGRPEGSPNFSTVVKKMLKEPVPVKQGGKRKTVATQTAFLLKLKQKALEGDLRALDRFIELARTYNNDEAAASAEKLSLTDEEVLEAYNARLLRDADERSLQRDTEAGSEPAEGAEKANDNDKTQEEDDDDWLN